MFGATTVWTSLVVGGKVPCQGDLRLASGSGSSLHDRDELEPASRITCPLRASWCESEGNLVHLAN